MKSALWKTIPSELELELAYKVTKFNPRDPIFAGKLRKLLRIFPNNIIARRIAVLPAAEKLSDFHVVNSFLASTRPRGFTLSSIIISLREEGELIRLKKE